MHFILLFSLIISLMSSVEVQGNEEEWDQMDWEDVFRLGLYSAPGRHTTEEIVSMLGYLDRRPHYDDGQKNMVKTYFEFSQISESHCYSGFFRYLTETIIWTIQRGSIKMLDYMNEMQRNQFDACRDLWTRNILLAKDKLGPNTQVKAKQFLDSFNVEPIPYPEQHYFPKVADLKNNLINGALSFVESQLGVPIKPEEIEQKYDNLVKKLCGRVEDKLKLETEAFGELYDSYKLIPSIDRETLDWIQIEGICRFALKIGIDNLAEEAYSIVIQREA